MTLSEDDSALRRAVLNRLPTSLYRYSSLEGERKDWIKRLIIKSQLYFVRPSSFNDPLDCRIPVNYDGISPLKARARWRRKFKEQFPHEDSRSIKGRVDELLNSLRSEKGRDKQNEVIYKSIDGNGIASFSSEPFGMLMWSYYANGHKGIAVRFRMTLENLVKIAPLNLPVEVKYSHDMPEISYYEIDSDRHNFLSTILGTKSKAWEHESEWRLITVNHLGYVQLPPSMIDGVILGIRIEDEDKNDVLKWVKERGDRLEVFQMIHKRGSFDLEMVPLTY